MPPKVPRRPRQPRVARVARVARAPRIPRAAPVIADAIPNHYVAHDISITPATQRRLLHGEEITLQPSQLGFNQSAFARNRVRVALYPSQLAHLERNYNAGRPANFIFTQPQVEMHGRGWGYVA